MLSQCHVDDPRHVECRQVNSHLALAGNTYSQFKEQKLAANPVQTNDRAPDPN